MTAYQPHPYQQRAIDYVLDHPSCLLSLDMGLGKTSIVLSAISQLLSTCQISRVLIIAPLYVAKDTWPREVQKWGFPVSISVACGSAAERQRALEANTDIVVINRENVIWLFTMYGDHIKSMFDMLVIDESSSFKSSQSKRFKILKKYCMLFERVVLLSGTPRPRNVEDLYSQIYLLDRGARLGRSLTAFRQNFEKPGRRNGYIVYDWIPLEGAENDIYKRLSDVSVSMTAEDYLNVPEEQIIDHVIVLPEKVMSKYKQLEKESVIRINEKTNKRKNENTVKRTIEGDTKAVIIGELLQFSNGAVYDTEHEAVEIHQEKLKALAEIIESTEEPVMVFYWFKHDLVRLKEYFKAYDPVSLKSQKDIADWNAGKIRLAFVHPASMGHGLNLQDGGHIIVWFGLSWSLEITQQANARLHRQGQKQKVQIHRLICKNTVDEDVIKSLDKKDIGQEGLINAIKARIASD